MLVYPVYPKVTSSKDNKLVLVESYKVNGVIIPAGYVSDGLTLKSKLFRLLVSKYAPKFMPFFFLHDYLCDREEYLLADSLSEEILFDIEKSVRTKLMMFAVKIYHRMKYGIMPASYW